MKLLLPLWCLLLLSLWSAGSVSAIGNIGDDAPALDIEHWVKGSPIALKDGKGTNVYVVEFWATWCPPCRVSIPLLTELQKKYRDQNLVLIGISNESEAEVRPFVGRMAETMDYPVATDKQDSTTTKYMVAYGMTGIPTAFVVNREGKIAWVGSPLRGLSNAVAQILSGKFDLADSKLQFDRMKKENSFQSDFQKYMLICSQGTREVAEEFGSRLLESVKEVPMLTTSMAITILTDGRLRFRDIKLAKRAAEAAIRATDRKEVAGLQALAMAMFELGEKDQSLEVLKEAIGKASDPREREILKQNLIYFEKSNQSLK